MMLPTAAAMRTRRSSLVGTLGGAMGLPSCRTLRTHRHGCSHCHVIFGHDWAELRHNIPDFRPVPNFCDTGSRTARDEWRGPPEDRPPGDVTGAACVRRRI